MQAAHLRDDLRARPKREMISIGKQHLTARRAKLFGQKPFDRRARADGHEDRRVGCSVGRVQAPHAPARTRIFRENFKLDGCHGVITGRVECHDRDTLVSRRNLSSSIHFTGVGRT